MGFHWLFLRPLSDIKIVRDKSSNFVDEKIALIKKKIEDFGENLRKDVHFSTTSVSSIMSADIKISWQISMIFGLIGRYQNILWNISMIFALIGWKQRPEHFPGKGRRVQCIWSQPETEEFAGRFPAMCANIPQHSKLKLATTSALDIARSIPVLNLVEYCQIMSPTQVTEF